MLFKMTEVKYQPNPVLERALDVLFILHADHEQNCSTSAMRGIGSAAPTRTPPSPARRPRSTARCTAAPTRPCCGCSPRSARWPRVPAFLKRVKAGEARLIGFGHRVYKVCDPRAAIIKRMADLVFAVTGKNPLLEVALELERIALEDDYFVTRHLYPNVDFYSGLIYQAMGFPPEMFPVLFAVPRTVGWLAQWEELLRRPRAADRAPAADLRGRDAARLRAARQAKAGSMTPRRLALLLVALPAVALCAQPAPASTARGPSRTCAAGADRPPAVRLAAGRPGRAPTWSASCAPAGVAYREQAFDAPTPAGTSPWPT